MTQAKPKMTNFILQDKIKNTELCDKLIEYHKASPYKGYKEVPNVISTDIGIDASQYEHPTVLEYLKELQEILDKYIKKYPMSNYYSPFQIQENINIQLYKPGEGYPVWHTERANVTLPMVNRHLVFMTYLNDVNDKGETEFYHQKLITKARKGVTLIWPADWTHTHRGIVSPTEEKYIITGWYNFI
jgi:prolyl 4-hydroxylase